MVVRYGTLLPLWHVISSISREIRHNTLPHQTSNPHYRPHNVDFRMVFNAILFASVWRRSLSLRSTYRPFRTSCLHISIPALHCGICIRHYMGICLSNMEENKSFFSMVGRPSRILHICTTLYSDTRYASSGMASYISTAGYSSHCPRITWTCLYRLQTTS